MGAIFGGNSGAGVSYIPAPSPVQAVQPEAIQADKAVKDAADKQKKMLAAGVNTANNIATTPLGVSSQADVANKNLLGQ